MTGTVFQAPTVSSALYRPLWVRPPLHSCPSGMAPWWLPATPSRNRPFQFHMAFGSACHACQHIGSWVAMAGFWKSPPQRCQQL